MAFVEKSTLIICVQIAGSRISNYKQGKIQNYISSNLQTDSKEKIYFQEHFYLFNYESEIREKIIQYKFREKSYLYKTLARLFIEDNNFKNFISNYNCITCVPLHKKRLKTRGYNQCELVAKEISSYFKIPFCKNLLIKNTNIVAQSTLNKEDRRKNISNAFSINLDSWKHFCSKNNNLNQKYLQLSNQSIYIAIFDDIFTTGATANECAKIISQLNPSKIGIITIAKD